MQKREILDITKKQNVRFLRLQFTDILGVNKNVEVPVSQIEKALAGDIMFDGSSIEGFVRIEESDMLLVPDLDTFRVFPWGDAESRVCRLICDVHKPDGSAFEGDPRGVLKRMLARAESAGLHDERGDGSRVLHVQAECGWRGVDDDPRCRELFRPGARGPGRGCAARDSGRARADGLRGGSRAPRSCERSARDRFPVCRSAAYRRQHRDLQIRGEVRCAEVRARRVLHAQAHVRPERERDAHSPVALPRRGQRVLRRERRVAAERHGTSLHRRTAEARARAIPRSRIRWSTPTSVWSPDSRRR